jgi:hypothetical protein
MESSDKTGKFQMVLDGTYPGTDLPVYKVYFADEYQDVTVRFPRSIGEVWAVGFKGVTGKYIADGVRYQLNGSYNESPLFPIGAFAAAARAMIEEF